MVDRPRGKSSNMTKLPRDRSKGVIHNLPSVVNRSQQLFGNKVTLKSINRQAQNSSETQPSQLSSKRKNEQIKGMMYIQNQNEIPKQLSSRKLNSESKRNLRSG